MIPSLTRFKLLQALLDFFLPRFCLLCKKYKPDLNSLICAECLAEFSPAETKETIMQQLDRNLSGDLHFDEAMSLWQFEGKVQTLIHHFKYNEYWSLGEIIADNLSSKLSELNIDETNSLLIPVPLHKVRLRERGYNQSEVLCQYLSGKTSIPLNTNLLHRIRNTQSQTKLNLNERKQNVNGAFLIRQNLTLENKTIILVDDVLTTGATTNACASELKKCSPRKIVVVTIAKA